MFAAENGLRGDPRLKGISEAIRVVPNFPKPGLFYFHMQICYRKIHFFPFFFLDKFVCMFLRENVICVVWLCNSTMYNFLSFSPTFFQELCFKT